MARHGFRIHRAPEDQQTDPFKVGSSENCPAPSAIREMQMRTAIGFNRTNTHTRLAKTRERQQQVSASLERLKLSHNPDGTKKCKC